MARGTKSGGVTDRWESKCKLPLALKKAWIYDDNARKPSFFLSLTGSLPPFGYNFASTRVFLDETFLFPLASVDIGS